VGPQDQKDVTRDIARDLSSLVGELAALIEAGRRVRLNERPWWRRVVGR
jgi:hypothetical protein